MKPRKRIVPDYEYYRQRRLPSEAAATPSEGAKNTWSAAEAIPRTLDQNPGV